jgi:cytochrome o ubiquinol oxidase subunit 2
MTPRHPVSRRSDLDRAHDLYPFKPIESRNTLTEVQVVSLYWKWLFIYPDQGVASVNELVVPAGMLVHSRSPRQQ